MDAKLVKISRFINLVLRHKPQTIGLTLDASGRASVDELISRAQRARVPLTLDLLRQVVAEDDKQRYAFSQDGLRIRASQGHSIPVELGLEPVTPPDRLYHGTARRFLDSILLHGLLAKGRQYVHLSSDEVTAIKVGRRHGEPIVLVVQADRMEHDGFKFYRSANGVWLTDRVPVEYLEIENNAEVRR
ncbi:MAG: RNA 2'-phosphotransferase [Chloroflexi bacterium]|nr:RNA 2'-phosphotransferase [Chloroflexota bacterium]